MKRLLIKKFTNSNLTFVEQNILTFQVNESMMNLNLHLLSILHSKPNIQNNPMKSLDNHFAINILACLIVSECL